VLSLQGEVTRAIAQEIRVKLTPQEQANLTKTRPINPEAYEACLKGRFEWYKLSKEGLDNAEHYYQLALEKDPNYALAYAGLADVWLERSDTGLWTPRDTMKQAKAAAQKALELDDTLSEAHVSLANIETSFEWNWPAAEKDFLRAIQLNPSNADAHFMYADFLISLKRNQEWQREMQQTLVRTHGTMGRVLQKKDGQGGAGRSGEVFWSAWGSGSRGKPETGLRRKQLPAGDKARSGCPGGPQRAHPCTGSADCAALRACRRERGMPDLAGKSP